MKPEINFQVYLGTVRGALANTQCKKDAKPKYNLDHVDSEITAMEWGGSEDDILIGKRNGKVHFYSAALNSYTRDISDDIEGEGAVVGLGSHEENIVVGRSNGVINIWNKNEKDKFSLSLGEDSTMLCMTYNKHRGMIGTGGEKNDLKIWDLEKKTVIFRAKSLGHDELNLPIPTTVRGICFFPLEEQLVACSTKEGHVLLYDERAQRRPVTKYHEVKASFTTLATAYRDRQCFAGTTRGYLQMIDLRQNKCMKTFKSFTGGITSIVVDAAAPFVATACLDRHLRIHNFETKELVYKEYMKMSLTKILMQPIIKEEIEKEEPAEQIEEDEEYESIFDKMETITEESGPKKVKRKVKDKTKGSKKAKVDK